MICKYFPLSSLLFCFVSSFLHCPEAFFSLMWCHLFILDLVCGSTDKESACYVEDLGLIPGLGRYPGEGKDYPTPVFWPREFLGLYGPWVTKSCT